MGVRSLRLRGVRVVAIFAAAAAAAVASSCLTDRGPRFTPRSFERLEEAEVPIRVHASRPVVEVELDGVEGLWFLLDTGTACAVVSPDVAARARLRPRMTAGSVDGAFPDQVRVRSLRVGHGVRLAGFDAVIRPLDELSRELDAPVDGILGAALLAEVRFTIDYPAERLRFPTGPPPRPDGRRVFAATTVAGRPRLTAVLGERILHPLVDTGVEDAIVLSLEDVAAVPFEGERPRLPGMRPAVAGSSRGGEGGAEGAGGDTGGDPSIGVCAVDLRLGELRVERPRVRAGRATRLGGAFLATRRVTFDLASSPRTITIEPGD